MDFGDMDDIKGLRAAKRALEVAAVNGRHVLLIGPPGCGKTMLATRFVGILPELTEVELQETAAVWERAHMPLPIEGRPLRAPHYTASDAGLVGGGTPPRPGEVSLAHNGVLFLDELPEFRRRSIEALQVAVKQGHATVRGVRFPAKVQIIATANPCPCGGHRCDCTPEQIERHRARVTAASSWMDPIVVEIPKVELRHFESEDGGDSSATIRARVTAARKERKS